MGHSTLPFDFVLALEDLAVIADFIRLHSPTVELTLSLISLSYDFDKLAK